MLRISFGLPNYPKVWSLLVKGDSGRVDRFVQDHTASKESCPFVCPSIHHPLHIYKVLIMWEGGLRRLSDNQ